VTSAATIQRIWCAILAAAWMRAPPTSKRG
jgi:hypothetical protein